MSQSSTNTEMGQAFWDERHSSFNVAAIEVDSLVLSGISPYGRKLFEHILGDLSGKTVLDLGCGNGSLSVYMAKRGAKVTSIDISKVSVRNTLALAEWHNVQDSINAFQLNALDIGKINHNFDLVIGKFILHHIEPFSQFSLALKDSLKNGGRGIFIENSARSPILRLAREYLVGKFGIPKFGDSEEYPLEQSEINLLAQNIGQTKITYPDFVFFRMMNSYIFKHNQKFRIFLRSLVMLDDFIYFYIPFLRKYSYIQFVEVFATPKV
jgi:2-polyprenyl-3-methyl-5-hydroxy-6-metoxy-1,4-benzoquinol methylase